MKLFYLAQLCGVLIFIFEICIILSDTKKKVLKYNTIVNAFSLFQYLFLKAYSGFFAIGITFYRNYILNVYHNKKKKTPFIYLVIVLTLLGISSFFTYKNILSLIPMVTTTIYTLAIWQDNIKNFHLSNMLICFLTAIYNFSCQAYISVFTQIVFIIVSALTFNKTKKRIKN